MGVTNLWLILEPAKQHIPLSNLRGQTLAVDLSIWIVENQGVKGLEAAGVSKPYLRNLFFRVSNLLQLGVNLVFVIEGEAPELKWQTMSSRQQAVWGQYRKTKGVWSRPRAMRRPQLKAKIKECCEMLDYLGVQYIQSEGEAEAMCAVLNATGLVDACITDDGDAFLYGARTIYRNFTLNTKDPHVESYSASDVQCLTGLTRQHLVGMALLLGCDYIPKGVPGIGKEKAMELMTELGGVDVLQRFRDWSSPRFDGKVKVPIEMAVRKKALAVEGFPNEAVIDEYLVSRNRCPTSVQQWRRPDMQRLQVFNYSKLEWPEVYSQQKVLPLATLWDIRDISASGVVDHSIHFMPNRIIKARVRQGVPCYEIEWVKPPQIKIIHVDDEVGDKPWITFEEKEAISKCFPALVRTYKEQIAKKSKGGKSRKPKKADVENITVQLEQLDVVDTASIQVCSGKVGVKREPKTGVNVTGDYEMPAMNRDDDGSSDEVLDNLVAEEMGTETDISTCFVPDLETTQGINDCLLESTSNDFDSSLLPLSERLALNSKTKMAKSNVVSEATSYQRLTVSKICENEDISRPLVDASTPSAMKLEVKTTGISNNLLFLSPVQERCSQLNDGPAVFTPVPVRKCQAFDRNLVDASFDNGHVCAPSVVSKVRTKMPESPYTPIGGSASCHRMFCDESSISLFDISVNSTCDQSHDQSHGQSGDKAAIPPAFASDSLFGDFCLQTSLLNNTSVLNMTGNMLAYNSAGNLEPLSSMKENRCPDFAVTSDSLQTGENEVAEISIHNCHVLDVDDRDLINLRDKMKDLSENRPISVRSETSLGVMINETTGPLYQNSPVSLVDRLKFRLSKTNMSSVLNELTNTQ